MFFFECVLFLVEVFVLVVLRPCHESNGHLTLFWDAVPLVLLDSNCVPVSLFEIEELWTLTTQALTLTRVCRATRRS